MLKKIKKYLRLKIIMKCNTPEQQQKNIAIKNRREKVTTEWGNLNLTADQMAEMKAIRQANKQQLNTILTPEQRAKVKGGNGRYEI